MHEPRRAAERHAAGFHEAAESADLLLFQEAGKPGSRFRHVRGVLQLLLADSPAGQVRQETAQRRDDGQIDRPRLEL